MNNTDLLRKMEALPPEKQQEVLDFVDFLVQRSTAAGPKPTAFYGLWADLGIDLSTNDLDAARRELWNSFPREDLP